MCTALVVIPGEMAPRFLRRHLAYNLLLCNYISPCISQILHLSEIETKAKILYSTFLIMVG